MAFRDTLPHHQPMKMPTPILPVTLFCLLLPAATATTSAQEASGESSPLQIEVVVDSPYPWLEDLDSPETTGWIETQTTRTREELDSDPRLPELTQRIRELSSFRRQFPPIRRGPLLFIAEGNPNTVGDASVLVRDEQGRSRTLVPPALDTAAEVPSLIGSSRGGLFPSPDGRFVAYLTSRRGSSWLTIRVVETATGALLDDRVDGLFGGLATVSWLPDGESFVYGRYDFDPAEGAQQPRENHKVLLHTLGRPQTEDPVIIADPDDPIRWFLPRVTDDGKWLVVTSGRGTAPEMTFRIAPAEEPHALRKMFADSDHATRFIGAIGSALWFESSEGGPGGSILRVDLEGDGPSKTTRILALKDQLVYANLVAERLIVYTTRDASPRATIHRLDGRLERSLPLPTLTTVWGPSTGGLGFVGRATDPAAYFIASGLFDPGTVYRLDPRTGEVDVFARVSTTIDPSLYTGEQVFYESRDGTRVPMWLAWKRHPGSDGPQPLWMYAYGALGWSSFPWYQPHIIAWLDQGGVYAMPGIRGGGEYGETWHQAGVRENRENAFEDYISAAEWLVEKGHTRADLFVGNGGSISGALASEALVRRPDLFAAMIVDIPVTDLLRFHEFNGGQLWQPDLGDATDPRQAAILLRHSPLHLIRSGRCYPATLTTAGEKDQVAAPHHAYRFTAALQTAQGCDAPIRIQVVEGAGHNFGTTIEQTASTFARQLVFALRAVE